MERWVGVAEAAVKAGRSQSTIRRWIRDGVIRSRRLVSGGVQVAANSLTKESLFQLKVDRILRGVI